MYARAACGCVIVPTRRRVVGGLLWLGELILLADAAVMLSPLRARAQEPAQSYRMGLLSSARIVSSDERRVALVRGLAKRGYVEGRNLVFEEQFAERERLPRLAAELARKTDVIVTFGYAAALAAK